MDHRRSTRVRALATHSDCVYKSPLTQSLRPPLCKSIPAARVAVSLSRRSRRCSNSLLGRRLAPQGVSPSGVCRVGTSRHRARRARAAAKRPLRTCSLASRGGYRQLPCRSASDRHRPPRTRRRPCQRVPPVALAARRAPQLCAHVVLFPALSEASGSHASRTRAGKGLIEAGPIVNLIILLVRAVPNDLRRDARHHRPRRNVVDDGRAGRDDGALTQRDTL